MPDWTRRDLLKASAGVAAVAVPMAVLSSTASAAGARSDARSADALAGPAGAADAADLHGGDPVMFCIHDARRGEVSILHGTHEVVVRDRQLVARIMRTAGMAPARW